jgi:hypothetical protein
MGLYIQDDKFKSLNGDTTRRINHRIRINRK